jgi:hypothetical protein
MSLRAFGTDTLSSRSIEGGAMRCILCFEKHNSLERCKYTTFCDITRRKIALCADAAVNYSVTCRMGAWTTQLSVGIHAAQLQAPTASATTTTHATALRLSRLSYSGLLHLFDFAITRKLFHTRNGRSLLRSTSARWPRLFVHPDPKNSTFRRTTAWLLPVRSSTLPSVVPY